MSKLLELAHIGLASGAILRIVGKSKLLIFLQHIDHQYRGRIHAFVQWRAQLGSAFRPSFILITRSMRQESFQICANALQG